MPLLSKSYDGDRLADRASQILLGLLALLVAATFTHYGSGFDGEVQDNYGQKILAWYASLGQDRSALTYIDLYYYGGLFDSLAALAEKITPFGHWATRHLLEACFGLYGLVGCWRLARHLGGPRAGFYALGVLALMPSYYGMMFINPKDIPFAATMIWAVYMITLVGENLPRPSARQIVALGLGIGLALAVRIGGVLLFAYLGAVIVSHLWAARGRHAGEIAWRLLLPVLVIAWITMLLFWPWAQVAPLSHPWEAIRHFSSMQNNIDTLFLGHEVGRTYHPALYLPVYLVIKLPDVALAMLIVAIVVAIRSRKLLPPLRLLPCILAAGFPLAYALITRPELYDADRHFLFVLPPLAVLLGLGFARLPQLTARRWAAPALLLLFVAGGARQVQAMADLHPYEYAFFNDVVGGTEGARGLFETEYWGASLAEATSDLSQYIVAHHLTRNAPWRVAICGHFSQMGDQHFPQLQPTGDWQNADFFVATTRGGCDQRIKGTTIGEVDRDGVPFAIVKDLRPPPSKS